MRRLARKGGAATKARADKGYYRRIGQLGGRASAAARFSIAAEVQSEPVASESESADVEHVIAADAPRAGSRWLSEIMAEMERP
jgi:general stress protein YciG